MKKGEATPKEKKTEMQCTAIKTLREERLPQLVKLTKHYIATQSRFIDECDNGEECDQCRGKYNKKEEEKLASHEFFSGRRIKLRYGDKITCVEPDLEDSITRRFSFTSVLEAAHVFCSDWDYDIVDISIIALDKESVLHLVITDFNGPY